MTTHVRSFIYFLSAKTLMLMMHILSIFASVFSALRLSLLKFFKNIIQIIKLVKEQISDISLYRFKMPDSVTYVLSLVFMNNHEFG